MLHSADSSGSLPGFDLLMAGYFVAAGITAPERHAGKYHLLIDGVVLIVSSLEHIEGPSVFVVAQFERASAHAAEFSDVVLSHNFLLQAVGAPIMWGINPLTDQIVAMCRLGLCNLLPEILGARLEVFVSSAKIVFDDMLMASLNVPPRATGAQGAHMRRQLMAQQGSVTSKI